MNESYYAVIMAGGGGTRLWPLSRKNSPKQLLNLIGEKSLFRIAIDRLDGVFPPERIFVVSVREQIKKLQEQAPEIPEENYLIEPMPRGTASVVGLAAAYLSKRDPESVMAVLTADHVMKNIPVFKELLISAEKIARDSRFVTIGIDPTYPATGYGYIQSTGKAGELGQFDVKSFKEKPDQQTAENYLASGGYFWNSGMFIWKTDTILAEIERQMPELMKTLVKIQEKITEEGKIGPIDELWASITPQTIDYGIMEGASGVTVIPARNLGWIDVGSWDSLKILLDSDHYGNVIRSNRSVAIDTRNSYIQTTSGDRFIAVVGLEDVFVIEHDNALLVCKKGESQKVKELISYLKDNDLGQFL